MPIEIEKLKPSPETIQGQSNPLSIIGQLIGLVAPFLYLLGNTYASNYFRALGCEWVLPLLTFQETIYYALPSAIPIVLGMIISLELMLGGMAFRTTTRIITYVFIASIVIEAILRIFTDFNLLDLIIKTTGKWMFSLFGAYIAHVFLSIRLHTSRYLKSVIGVAIGSAFSVYIFSGQLGGVDANTALTSNNNIFPTVTKGYTFGAHDQLQLLAKVGDKYLLMRNTKDNKAFKLESNLDSYSILTINPETTNKTKIQEP